MEAESNNTCPFVSYHLDNIFKVHPPCSMHFIPSWLSSIPLDGYVYSLFKYLLMNIWAVSTFNYCEECCYEH